MKRNLVSLATLVLAYAVFIGCAPQPTNSAVETDQNQNSIVNGSKIPLDSDLFSRVLFLTMESETEYSSCSATAISKRVLLTAAHCIHSDTIKITAAFIMPGVPLTEVEAKAIIVVPTDYYEVPAFGGYMKANDIALIVLKKALPNSVKITQLNDGSEIKVGTNVILSGYGLTEKDPVKNGTRVSGDRQPYLTKGSSTFFEKSYSKLGFKGTATACFGDSGGPAFKKSSSGELIQVGVSSAVENGACVGESYYESIHDHYSWIKKTLQKIAIYNDTTESKPFNNAAVPVSIVNPSLAPSTLQKVKSLLEENYYYYNCFHNTKDRAGDLAFVHPEVIIENPTTIESGAAGHESVFKITRETEESNTNKKQIVTLQTAANQSIFRTIDIDVYVQQKKFLRKSPWLLTEKYQCKPNFGRIRELNRQK